MLGKLAEQMVFDRVMADDFLTSQSGLLGLVYLKPNAYMDSCNATFNKLKIGGKAIRALSVKECGACKGCSNCKTASDGSRKCALYGKPIVASEADVRALLAEKKMSMKKATLVALHNGNKPESMKQAPERALVATATRSTKHITPSQTFTAKDVSKQLTAGADIQSIYHNARKQFGSSVTAAAVKTFIASLRGTNTKLALRQVDCALLKKKLASTETIIGESKCASCAMRTGMHCGLTGGTLLSYPGMEKSSSGTKIASSGPEVDGAAVMHEYDLNRRAAISINVVEPERLDVEMPRTFGMNLE